MVSKWFIFNLIFSLLKLPWSAGSLDVSRWDLSLRDSQQKPTKTKTLWAETERKNQIEWELTEISLSLSLSLSLSHTHTHTHFFSLSLFLPLTFSLSLTLYLLDNRTYAHSYRHTQKQPHLQKYYETHRTYKRTPERKIINTHFIRDTHWLSHNYSSHTLFLMHLFYFLSSSY